MQQTQIPTRIVEPESLLSEQASQEVAISFVIPVMNEEQDSPPVREARDAA